MGTKFRTCWECLEKSRSGKHWFCPHCGSGKPVISQFAIEVLKPKAKAQSRPEYVSYKQWLVQTNREASHKAWTDYMLRDLRPAQGSHAISPPVITKS